MKSDIPQITIDEIVKKIKEEVDNRKKNNKNGITIDSLLPTKLYKNEKSDSANTNSDEIKTERKICICDLLKYHDEEFIVNAYRVLLKRDPDYLGLQNNLVNLRNLKTSKIGILGSISFSKEGKQRNIKVYGLKRRYILYKIGESCFKIPIIGYFIKLIVLLISLPSAFKNVAGEYISTNERITENKDKTNLAIDRTRSELTSRLSESDNKLDCEINKIENEFTFKLRNSENEFASKIKDLENEVGSKIKDLENKFISEINEIENKFNPTLDEIDNKFGKICEGFTDRLCSVDNILSEVFKQIKEHKLNILEQQRKMTIFLEEVKNRFSDSISSEQIKKVLSEEEHMLDAMYVSFEEQFRGEREDIKERIKFYLPYMKQLQSEEKDMNILDIGCGRGEWLELLKENGYEAKGIDLNRVMVNYCKELKLDVIESDAIEYLKKLKTNSLDVITGFHIVEHLSIETLIALIDESFRVLKPKGMLIFETPNPENIIVGSCSFYSDPTHRNPIPPETLKFFVSSRGFSKAEIVRLHPLNYFNYDNSDDSMKHISFRFNMEQDYSVLAVKS
ncbi:MAG: methyltransferase domain-containing protein [Ignavibacteriales bacterium]